MQNFNDCIGSCWSYKGERKMRTGCVLLRTRHTKRLSPATPSDSGKK
jgi:hypothetical protein